MKRKLIGLLLVLCMLVSLLPALPVSAAAAQSVTEPVIRGGSILHCFDWSYNSIRAALADIKAAGYTAVQTSPVQPPKDYRSDWTDTDGQWWKLYQPLGIRISDGNTWLGTRQELIDLCSEAEALGIYVIVDIVANHLANKEDGGGYAHLSGAVDDDMKNPDYYHTDTDGIDYSSGDRYNITHRHMGMPDLNTGHGDIQQKVLDLLKDCVNCGVDGFRFDAAKHIELPSDPEGARSDFWSYVTDGIRAYKPDVFLYGEVLGDAGYNTPITSYTTYLAITDSQTGNNARNYVTTDNASGLANSTYIEDSDPENCVLWAESHDTYMHGDSNQVSDADIVNTWAIVGAREGSTSLFLARPGDVMGEPGSDMTWESDAVTEINRFKAHFDGCGEYLSNWGTSTYIERGTNGVVISKLDGGGAVNFPAHRMADGVYTDQITGNTFTVSGGMIRGTVGSTGVAVVYNTNETAADSSDTITAETLWFYPNSNWRQASARFAMYLFNDSENAWVSLTSEGNGFYKGDVPDGSWSHVIFCRMSPSAQANNWDNKWNQTANLNPRGSENCFTMTFDDSVWDGDFGSWCVYGDKTVFAVDQAGWGRINIYYWRNDGSKNAEWPGEAMTSCGNGVYTFDVPCNVTNIIFNDGVNNSGRQTGTITGGIIDGASWTVYNDNSTSYSATQYTPYTVRLMPNGGTGSAVEFDMFTGVTGSLPSNTFTNGSLVFNGWNTDPNGMGVTYANEASVTDLAPAGGEIVLYAMWIAADAPSYNAAGSLIEIRGRTSTDYQKDLRFKISFNFNGNTYWNGSGNGSGSYELSEFGYRVTYTSASFHNTGWTAARNMYFTDTDHFDFTVVMTGIPESFYEVVFTVDSYVKYSSGGADFRVNGVTLTGSVDQASN